MRPLVATSSGAGASAGALVGAGVGADALDGAGAEAAALVPPDLAAATIALTSTLLLSPMIQSRLFTATLSPFSAPIYNSSPSL